MSKITRKLQKIFASNAGGSGVAEFGSIAGGSPAYSTDPDDIQTTAYINGWLDAVVGGKKRLPTIEDMNAIHFVLSRQLAYIYQEGIAEYDSGTEYNQYSIVKKTGTYELYGSKINANTGNALPSQVDDSNWQYLGDLSDLVNASDIVAPAYTVGLGSWESKNADTVYQASTDLIVIGYAVNSTNDPSITIATDSSNPPLTTRVWTSSAMTGTDHICASCPVKKGDYYKVNMDGNNSEEVVYIIPLS